MVGLRESGLTYDAIAAQVGLTRTGVFNICRRFAEQGLAGLASGPRGPAPGTGRCLTAKQEAQVRPRVAQVSADNHQIRVSSELRGTVEVFDAETRASNRQDHLRGAGRAA